MSDFNAILFGSAKDTLETPPPASPAPSAEPPAGEDFFSILGMEGVPAPVAPGKSEGESLQSKALKVAESFGKGALHEVKKFAEDTASFFTVGAKSFVGAPKEISSFVKIMKDTDLPTAAHAYWVNYRDTLGLPVSQDEMEGLAADMLIYGKEYGNDPLKLQGWLSKTFGHLSPEEEKSFLRGYVNIAALLVPGAPFEEAALKLFPKSALLERIAAAEMHSIASFTAWTVGQAAVEGEDPKKAATEGVLLGAAAPGLGYLGGRALGLAGRGVGAGLRIAQKAINPPAKAIDQALQRMEIYTLTRNFLQHVWDKGATAVEEVIRKSGASRTADSLVEGRGMAHTQAANWIARVYRDGFSGLKKEERELIQRALHAKNTEDAMRMIVAEVGEDGASNIFERMARVSEVLNEVGDIAQEAGVPQYDQAMGRVRRFFKRNDFGTPHRFTDAEQFMEPGPARAEALKRLRKQGHSQQEAENILQELFDATKVELNTGSYKGYANLMGRRYNLPGYESDPAAYLMDYFFDMAKKIEYTVRFGTPEVIGKRSRATTREMFPRAFEEADKIADPIRRQVAMEGVERQLGGYEVSPRGSLIQILTKLAQYQGIMKLGLAQITQATQFVTPNTVAGFRGALTDLLRLGAKDPLLHDRLLRTGSFLESMVRASHEQFLGTRGELGSKVLRRTGFTWMDTAARRYAAIRGFTMAEYTAERMARMLKLQPNAKGLEARYVNGQIKKMSNQFRRLGIDPEKVIENGGRLLEDDYLKAGQKLSTDTNFWTDTLSLPLWATSPWGRLAFQFKSFTYQQGRFVKEAIVKPALEGDTMPLVRLGLSAQITGEIVADLKAGLRGRKRDLKATERLLENYAQGAAFGIYYDMINSTRFSEGLWRELAGPQMSDFVDIGMGGWELTQGRINRLGRRGIMSVPMWASMVSPWLGAAASVAAPAIANTLFPSKTQQRERKPKSVR